MRSFRSLYQTRGGTRSSLLPSNPASTLLPPHNAPLRLPQNCQNNAFAISSSLPETAGSSEQQPTLHAQHEEAAPNDMGSLEKHHEDEGTNTIKAAGVMFYCLHPTEKTLQILLVWQKKRLTLPGGKRQSILESGMQIAAREVEEETHWQLSADRVMGLLQEKDSKWIPSSKYQLYWVHLPGEWDIVDRINAKIARKEMHPEARKVTAAMWADMATIMQRKAPDGKLMHHVMPTWLQHVKAVLRQKELQLQRLDSMQTQPVQPAPTPDTATDTVTRQLAEGLSIQDAPHTAGSGALQSTQAAVHGGATPVAGRASNEPVSVASQASQSAVASAASSSTGGRHGHGSQSQSKGSTWWDRLKAGYSSSMKAGDISSIEAGGISSMQERDTSSMTAEHTSKMESEHSSSTKERGNSSMEAGDSDSHIPAAIAGKQHDAGMGQASTHMSSSSPWGTQSAGNQAASSSTQTAPYHHIRQSDVSSTHASTQRQPSNNQRDVVTESHAAGDEQDPADEQRDATAEEPGPAAQGPAGRGAHEGTQGGWLIQQRLPVKWPEGVPLSDLPERPQITVVGQNARKNRRRRSSNDVLQKLQWE